MSSSFDAPTATTSGSLWRARLWVYAVEAVILLGFVGLVVALLSAVARD
jgi:hypothetical protein